MTLPTYDQIDKARQKSVWDFGNAILYRLCKENFEHRTNNDGVLTKVLFIGRIYAAAVDRRKINNDNVNSDFFYTHTIAPAFIESQLDDKLSELKRFTEVDTENIKLILEGHNYLVNILNEGVTGLKKRSFSSKYLHFHLPELFYIYDSRAVTALRGINANMSKGLKPLVSMDSVDEEYACFFCKCFELKMQIKREYKIELTNRQLDNLLIDIA